MGIFRLIKGLGHGKLHLKSECCDVERASCKVALEVEVEVEVEIEAEVEAEVEVGVGVEVEVKVEVEVGSSHVVVDKELHEEGEEGP